MTVELRFPFRTADAGEPAPEFARLREEQPVAKVTLPSGDTAWLVTRYEDNRTVLSDPRFSRGALTVPGAPRLQPIPPDPASMLNMDPPDHTRLRGLVSRHFSARRIATLRPAIERDVEQLLDELEAAGQPADLVSGFAHRLPTAVVCELLGIPAADRAEVAGRVDVMLSLGAFPLPRVKEARAALKAYLADLIGAKRRAPEADLISDLVTDQDDTLAEDELVMLVATVLTGGFLSTVNELTLVFLCLLRHPRQTALVREHPELLPGAVDELLRYNAPTAGGGLLRIATEDVQLGGVTISAGDAVLPAISSANRDSGVFADADRFDVTRADNRHLTYGRGPHFCLGAGLASLELEIAIAGVLRRFPALRLAVRPAELGVRSGHLMRGLTRLPVRW